MIPLIAFALVAGMLNPQVTQATIKRTICHRGWTTRVRPPQYYTSALKRKQMKEMGLVGPMSAFKEDHKMPLELGGATMNPVNLVPQEAGQAAIKDREENDLRRKVCSGARRGARADRRDWPSGRGAGLAVSAN